MISEKTHEKVYASLNRPKTVVEEILKKRAGDINKIMVEMISFLEPVELREAVGHLISAGGKRARAVISLLSCEAVGGEQKFALPAAVSCEFIHTASLVHDDIVDVNETRRGKESVHITWGVPTGVLVGDLLLAMGTKAMLEIANRVAIFTPDEVSMTNMSKSAFDDALNTLSLFTDAWITLCQGKEVDVVLKKKRIASEEDVFKMMYQKTAVLYEISAKSGATAGNGSTEEIKGLGDYGKLMGLAFQIKDDILGLIADETEFGKPVGMDIREGKKTIMVVHALSNGGDKDAIYGALGNEEASPNQIISAIESIKEAGSIDYAKKMAVSLGERAKKSLDILQPSDARNNLLDLADYLVDKREW